MQQSKVTFTLTYQQVVQIALQLSATEQQQLALQLGISSPDKPTDALTLAQTYLQMGNLYQKLEKPKEALAYYHKATSILESNMETVDNSLENDIENHNAEVENHLETLGFNLKIKSISPREAKNGIKKHKINAEEIVGKWPGEETIEELLELLEK